MRVTRTYLRQAFSGTSFRLGVIGTALSLVFACFSSLLSTLKGQNLPMEAYYGLFRQAVSSETLKLILPIVAALPFTASYYDDLHSGFIKESLPRAGYRKYLLGKVEACLLSGGMAPVIGVLCFRLIISLAILPKTAYFTIFWNEVLWAGAHCLLLFFSGALWSLVGMTGAALTNSKYMAYSAPFILFYVLVVLEERYFKRITILNPKTWLETFSSLWVVWLLGAATIFAFLCCGKRRLHRL